MPPPNLPVNIDTTYADSGTDASVKTHQQHHDAIHSIVNKLDTGIAATNGHVLTGNGTTFVNAAPTTGASLNAAADHIYYISKSGSDTNDGRSWATPFLTLARAITVNAGFPATYNLGFGTFVESGLVITNGSVVRGSSMNGTILRLGTSGTLVDLTDQTGAMFENVKFEFASSSVTGTLVKMSNAFACIFNRCWFAGTTTASQVGVWLLANAGDSTFYGCRLSALAVAVQNDTTINTFIGCNFQSNTVAIRGGDTSGVAFAAGLMVRDSVFGGAGTYYIDLAGTSQAWFFDNCWLDAGVSPATGVRVGTGTYGPWLFSWTNSGSLFGNTTSLLLNACSNVILDNTVFGNDGANPTEISVPTPANVVRGRIGRCWSVQANNNPESMVPATFDGWRGYGYYDSGQITLLETSEYQRSNPSNANKKTVTIRFSGRASGAAQTVVTFPAAFTTSQFFKVFDNTAATGLVLTASTLTIPTGNAVSSGMIVIEGW